MREVEATGGREERRIHKAVGWMMGSERNIEFVSDMYLDCTGDGLVGFLAGAEFRIGREARNEYGEKWAPEQAANFLVMEYWIGQNPLGSAPLKRSLEAAGGTLAVPQGPGLGIDIDESALRALSSDVELRR